MSTVGSYVVVVMWVARRVDDSNGVKMTKCVWTILEERLCAFPITQLGSKKEEEIERENKKR